MIYKLISHVGGQSFAALVGTDPQDQFVPNFPMQHPKIQKRTVGRKVKKRSMLSDVKRGLVPAGHTAIGFTSFQASYIFQQWKDKNPYAFVKENHMLYDYAFIKGTRKTTTGRPMEGISMIRRLSIKPLVMINLEKYPAAGKSILKIKPFLLIPPPAPLISDK